MFWLRKYYCNEGEIMRLYTSDGCAYVGMDEATVARLRTELGKGTVFITEEEYNILIGG